LLLSACAFGESANTIYISGNNAGAVAVRKDMPKACPNLTLVESSANAEYVLDIGLDANGAANGTLTKSGNGVWSDSYDSNFYHYSDRGKLNSMLLFHMLGATLCRTNKAAK
jgi:hypothetical protein